MRLVRLAHRPRGLRVGAISKARSLSCACARGLGNAESVDSGSHGAGRVMSRTQAGKLFTGDDQIRATEGVECPKYKGVIGEIPMAYKDIDAVMKGRRYWWRSSTP